jgi:hypothetical protein
MRLHGQRVCRTRFVADGNFGAARYLEAGT